ncbi:MAG TPA: family 16 glycosylhydrolase [Bacteroidia bacterium]|jgi:beta-glucanase (GH16 family)|nr:family 16 glycosylhydrolase [Bacteroidia bacterium]
MNQIKLQIIIGLFFLAGSCSNIEGQAPAIDANWQLDTTKSDEFNGLSVNTTKWHVLDCPSGDCCNYGGGTAFQKGNAIDSAGKLWLRTDGPGPAPIPCSRGTYATGGITSNLPYYSYGYYEMYAKLPGFIDGSGVAHADKFWPAFWMAYNPICSIHNEIDVMDECCCVYSDAETTGSGWNEAGVGADSCQYRGAGWCTYINPVPLCNGYHKFAVEWTTNRMIFYRDDIPYFQTYNSPTLKMNPQYLFIDLQISSSCDFYPGTPFPQYMAIDYFRYYKLNLDCGTNVIFAKNSDISGFTYGVKNSIIFGNSSGSIDLSGCGSKSYVFRAVNGFTINGDFTAPKGYELTLAPTACN